MDPTTNGRRPRTETLRDFVVVPIGEVPQYDGAAMTLRQPGKGRPQCHRVRAQMREIITGLDRVVPRMKPRQAIVSTGKIASSVDDGDIQVTASIVDAIPPLGDPRQRVVHRILSVGH
jgi:hypothetical protein